MDPALLKVCCLAKKLKLILIIFFIRPDKENKPEGNGDVDDVPLEPPRVHLPPRPLHRTGASHRWLQARVHLTQGQVILASDWLIHYWRLIG